MAPRSQRLQHVVGCDGQQAAAAGGLQGDSADQVAAALHGHRPVMQHQQDAPGRHPGRQQRLQNGAPHLGLEAQRQHPARARVERPVGLRLGGKRIVAAVGCAHRAPELPVALAGAVALICTYSVHTYSVVMSLALSVDERIVERARTTAAATGMSLN